MNKDLFHAEFHFLAGKGRFAGKTNLWKMKPNRVRRGERLRRVACRALSEVGAEAFGVVNWILTILLVQRGKTNLWTKQLLLTPAAMEGQGAYN